MSTDEAETTAGLPDWPTNEVERTAYQAALDHAHERGELPGLPAHGEYSRYRGTQSRPPCRCPACRKANADRNRKAGYSAYDSAYRTKLRSERLPYKGEHGWLLVHPNPPGGHGTITSVKAAACQCVPCVAARPLGRNLTEEELAEHRAELAELASWAEELKREGVL